MEPYNNQVFDWHTLEGAFIVPHEGRYYCFYSAAAYHSETYGVDYAVANHPLGPWHDDDNQTGPRILRTIPGTLRGPGHNSVFTGPDGQQYLAFHAWNSEHTKRQMHIAPLVWTESGPRVGTP
jgi:GH43 family beta-xylosidase